MRPFLRRNNFSPSCFFHFSLFAIDRLIARAFSNLSCITHELILRLPVRLNFTLQLPMYVCIDEIAYRYRHDLPGLLFFYFAVALL